MKIGIFSGAFDPFTIGHEKVLLQVLEYVDQIWLVPSFVSEHGKKMSSFESRLDMCNIIASKFKEPNPFRVKYQKVVVCDYGKYCLDGQAVTLLNKILGKTDSYYFVLGTDNANMMDTWKDAELIKKALSFIIISRPGYNPKDNAWYTKPPHIFTGPVINTDISSTIVRNEIATKGHSELLDHDVMAYIKEKVMYQKDV